MVRDLTEWQALQVSYFMGNWGTSSIVDFSLFKGLFYSTGMKVIDIGMNGGYLVEKLLNMGMDAYGLDLYPLAERARQEQPSIADRLFDCDLETEEIPGSEYDLALALGVIEHLEGYRYFFEKVNRCLKPEGVCFVTTCDGDAIKVDQEPYHTKHFSSFELTGLAMAGGFALADLKKTSVTNLVATFRKIKEGE